MYPIDTPRQQGRVLLVRQVSQIVMVTAFIMITTGLVAYQKLSPLEGVALAVGQVAPTDIRAPRSITYASEVLTTLAQQSAADAVRPVYDPPDPNVLRQQVQLARNLLDYLESVRADRYAKRDQQLLDIKAISAVKLPADLGASMLDLTEDQWKDVDAQVMQLLDRAMRSGIREENLPDVFAALPNLVSVTITDKQSDLIVKLVPTLIRANVFFNEERTKEVQQRARQSVPTETRNFQQGQIVIRAGALVTEADVEALTQIGLLQPADRRIQLLTGALLIVLLVSTVVVFYIRRFYAELIGQSASLILIGGLYILFIAGARIFSPSDVFLSHLYPAAAFALIIVTVVNPQLALILGAALAIMIGLIAEVSLEITLLIAIGSAVGVLTLRRTERLNAYFIAGLTIGASNIGISFIFMLVNGEAEVTYAVSLVTAGLLNGMLSAGVGLVGLYLVSSILNLPTSIKLLELAQSSQPLLQRLLREAPGTYQHSLQVANLTELAAERIGANASFLRVAALYHDTGKMVAPHYFVENQADGANPHDALADPARSAQIIISHVTEGEKLARKHRLPAAIIDMVLQHHGTMKALYFYNKALEAVDCDATRVDEKLFTYPGPRPQSREAGILMLADVSESIIRAKRPRNKQEVEQIINDIFQKRLTDQQLDQSHLTLNDLHLIRDVFISTLQGVYHPRIAYPVVQSTQEMQAIQLAAPKMDEENKGTT